MKYSTPRPPATLTSEAKVLWKRILDDFDLDDSARMILRSALEHFDRANAAAAIVKEKGLTVVDRFGIEKMHPAVLIQRDSSAAMVRALKALGLDLEPLNSGPGRPPGG